MLLVWLKRTLLLSALTCVVLGESLEFRAPGSIRYQFETPRVDSEGRSNWWRGTPLQQGRAVDFGPRVVVQTTSTNLPAFFRWAPELRLKEKVTDRLWLLEARDAATAVRAAARLATLPGIEIAVPTSRRRVQRHFPISPIPNDHYFDQQYSLETHDRTASFLPTSVDLNVREAWAYSRGAGVIVGVGDDGIEATHPDLAANFAGPNHNFLTGGPSGDHVTRSLFHGTAVAGLIAAVGDNGIGLTGVAPKAKLASWVIFDETDTNQPDDAGFAALFGMANQEVGVQNHSWGNADQSFVEVSLLEYEAIQKAVTEGRSGRGVVIVRSAGNTRQQFSGAAAGDANLDGYANDPRQITVASVRTDGRYASYSTPGSCVLVAAPGGDFQGGYPGLITTDRVGSAGLNPTFDPSDPTSSDYLVGTRLFVGTSAAAPLVSGVAALIVSARPELRWFEVQQILALSARHIDLRDPDLRTNGAGLRVSPNVGFGIPDAGAALRLAMSWKLQASPQKLTTTVTTPHVIPDPPANAPSVPLRLEFEVSDNLVVQHVQVPVRWSHPSGGELQVTLTSPQGTKSLLLRYGSAQEPVPAQWAFSSVEHLGESSRGRWVLEFFDGKSGNVGQIDEASLVLEGRSIVDTDGDGLDDDWEREHFGNLDQGPQADPDGDGWNNAVEQFAGRDPTKAEEALVGSVGRAVDGRLRLTWPASGKENYQIWSAPQFGGPLTLKTNVPGRFPEAGWFVAPVSGQEIYQIRSVP